VETATEVEGETPWVKEDFFIHDVINSFLRKRRKNAAPIGTA
jgi:hypothetical protein